MKIESDFALLDVIGDTTELNKRVNEAPECGIPVVIRGFIYYAWGGHDGKSQEFVIRVNGVEVEA